MSPIQSPKKSEIRNQYGTIHSAILSTNKNVFRVLLVQILNICTFTINKYQNDLGLSCAKLRRT